ncbi:MAG: outer membrane beta-barrel protein [Muribaculaceae bacterium]|nr:outer membrane beta-barrel protein [Muribaculaceae bacterium]
MQANRSVSVTLLLFSLILFPFTAAAYTLRGSVLDDATGETLIQASVRVLKAAPDSALVKGAVTNNRGRFRISDLPEGRYIVETSYVGMATQTLDIDLKADMTLDPVRLRENAIALKEAVVTGIRTPVKVMEDTIEFSAESYKTQPNAVVEDLLKRLPGVEVSSDGKITSNGKEVTKILVDGKEFFGDDPTVASRNLPVNMVEKLQVVDRKSDLARLTGVDDGEEETVINLTVKKNMKNGWFGNVEGGYGYGDQSRYNGNFNVNRFWNDNQVTFLGSANNINAPTFTDGAGGRFRRFGGDNGLTTAQAAGVNFNVGRGEIFRVGGNMMYSHTERDTRTQSYRRYNLAESDIEHTDSKSEANDQGHNIRGDFRVQWKPDSMNTFDFRPNFSLNYNDSRKLAESQTYASLVGSPEMTRSVNRSSSDGSSYEFGGNLIFNHNFRARPGRSFSVQAQYRYSNVREDEDTYSWNKFFLLDGDIDEYDQLAHNRTWTSNVNARLTWTEPLGKASRGNFLNFSYRFAYRWNNADKMTYDVPLAPEDEPSELAAGDPVYNEELSNRFRNNYMNQDIRAGFKHVDKSKTIDAGLSLVPQMSRSIDLINSANNLDRWVWNYAPYLRMRFKMSKTRSINAFYRGRSSQPSMAQMQPVADVSDPLNIVQGNPDLKPSFTHFMNLRFQDFNHEAQRSIMAMVFANFMQNSIASRTVYDNETGGRTTTYENVNGVWNMRAMNMVSFPFRNKAFTFNNHLFLDYSRSVGFNNGLRNAAGSFGVGLMPGIAWRPENLELELRPTYRLSSRRNSTARQNDRTTHSYGGSFYATYYTPWGIVLNTDLDYRATAGYEAGYNENTWMWNASISYQFLKDKSATVTVKGYDLLGQVSNIRTQDTGNYFEDTRYNALTRYVMVSFSYKFNTFGKGQQPVDRNAPRWGGPGPGMHPGGRPPMH